MSSRQGIIYIIGTGPGDTGLLTVKGLALLREADAIVANLLAQPRLLQEANPEAELHDVGSRTGGNKLPQAEVNRLLIELARQGKRVVRLWPGDPFIFGRGAQEMAEAVRAGIRVEIVPGVSSAIAAPAYAGVPLTHWDYAATVAITTGFIPEGLALQPNWSALAGADTLVVLMPLQNLADSVDHLLAAGRAADTPAMVVEQGTMPQQKQVIATLGTLVEAVQARQIASPAIVVVGAVVGLAGQLAWFRPGPEYPLLGQRVLVTRPAHQAADFVAALRALGAEPVAFPTIEICPVEDTGPLEAAIGRLATYDWLVLTSVNGVAAFWERLQALGLDSRHLAPVRVAAIGPATAAALQNHGVRPDLLPQVYTAEGLLAAFDEAEAVAGQRFLLARADIARPTLAQGLQQRGGVVDEIPAYRTVPVAGGKLPPAADIITFTSSSTVQGYVNCLGGRSPTGSRVACIGPITAATAGELGLPVDAMADTHTIAGLLDVLKEM